uniref:ATP synthase F(0) complex subunit e, mitochondrial n=1 Tax=Panthera tigris altaica TaxID=74533 RepID=A0A8C9J925_PANTA
MVPPSTQSLLIKYSPCSALFLGVAYRAKCYRSFRIAAEEKKKQDEWKHIERELAEAQDDSILK